MNVLLVTGLVAGGVGRHVEMLVRGLVGRGYRVVVACPEDVSQSFDLTGARIVPIQIGARPHPWRDQRTVRTLARLFAGADVVHAHGIRAGALASLARGWLGNGRWETGRRHGPRLVVTTHNAAPHHAAPSPAGASGASSSARTTSGVATSVTAALAYRLSEELVVRGADLVLGVSPDLVDRARAAGAAEVGLAVVPARDERDRPTRDAVEVRRELGLPENEHGGDGNEGPLLVVSVGRLAEQKDHASLIEAQVEVLRRWPTTPPPHLVIAGDGPERARLQERIDARLAGLAGLAAGPVAADPPIRLLGQRSDVSDLLAAADLVVSSARWEGQPVWLQEALQRGCPIVATAVGGTGLLLDDGAELIHRDDSVHPSGRDDPSRALSHRLADAMWRVLTDPDHRADLRSRALARAAELPTEEDALEATLTAYRGGGAGPQPTPPDAPGAPGAPDPRPLT
ncbi:glycosyltransferase family 4 protein [Ornithinimicrobium sp. Y1847]|uniref:glycosyltransferase family 4 protein n=1 Tax=Ornithinimicrobium sp. Y1847 TaxID=3405419 RepID=UPI003B66DEB1